MGRSLAACSLAALLALGPTAAQGQGLVVRDGTLGEGPLEVGPGIDPLGQAATYLITPGLGEQQGGNLFHSFARFGIGAGETATFTGPDPIEGPQSVSNVISRVTGGDASEIYGTLRSTIPGADLWLLNPSGVVFGDGASLDVPGSFHAGTGDYVGFGEGGLERFFGDPSRPGVLSTARPEAFGFLGESAPAPISVIGATLATKRAGDGLELAGGDVTFTRATLGAPGGQIAIRGGRIVVEEGSKVLAETAEERPAGAITLEARESLLVDGSLLSVSTSSAGDAGALRIASPEVTLANGPGFSFGDPNTPVADAQATAVGASAETSGGGAGGTIDVEAGSLVVTRGASVSARTLGLDATGSAGTIRIRGIEAGAPADRVEVSARSDISAGAWRSQGDAGAVEIDASRVTVDGAEGYASIWTTSTDSFLAAYAIEDPSVSVPGAPGRMDIEASSVAILNGGTIQSGCVGCTASNEVLPPDAPTIRIVAPDLVVDGANQLTESSILVNTFGGSADSGWLRIEAGTLLLSNGGTLRAGTQASSGDGGLIQIAGAESVTITESNRRGFGSGIFSPTGTGGTGDAGTIEIEAESLLMSSADERPSGSAIVSVNTDTGSQGQGGLISLEVGSLVIAPGGIITAEAGTGSSGNAGHVTVRADSVRIGSDPDAPPSGRVRVPAFITASAFGTGKAGTIEVDATESIFLSFERGVRLALVANFLRSALGGLPGLFSGVFSATAGEGDGGSIRLSAPDISVTHGAIVATSTIGGGTGGTILLEGERLLVTNGGSVDSSSLPHPLTLEPSGDAGDVTLIASEAIEVLGSDAFGVSRVSSFSAGSGAAGALTLQAPTILVEGGAVATTAVRSGDEAGQEGTGGGAITLVAEELLVTNEGQIDASTFIAGPGGSIDVTATRSIVVAGEASSIASRTGSPGDGGSVTLRAPTIEIADGGEVSAKSEPGFGGMARVFAGALEDGLLADAPSAEESTGNAGSLTLASDKLFLAGGTLATNSEAADGGNVTIQAKKLVHLDAGQITASVNGGLETTGGNVEIDPEAVILQNGSRIVAQAAGGSGGKIRISADSYFAFPGSEVSAEADRKELSGTVEVNTPDVNLAGQLVALPTSFLDAASLMKEPCAARRSGERAGSFAVRAHDGVPPEPDGWLAAPVVYEAAPGVIATSSSATASPPLPAPRGCGSRP